jgi:hypothetical protein
MRYLLIAAIIICTVVHSADAQVLRGRVTHGDSVAVPGVLVFLLDQESRVVARSLSDGRGEYRLTAPAPGTWSVRTIRVGFLPSALASLNLVAGEELRRDLPLRELAVRLDTVRVASRARCSASTGSREVAAVWEQARVALTAAQLTAGNSLLTASVLRQEHAVDARNRGERVLVPSQRTSGPTARGWTSLAADSLHRGGYVHLLRDGTLSWYAPDVEVLLSDHFRDDHCFRLTRTSDAMGLEFEPVRDRRDRPEISGTLWLDLHTAELRHMDFRYVNVAGVDGGDPGGDMRFVRLANGGWAVERWSIRMPVFVERQRPSSGVPGDAPRKERVHVETRIASGQLAFVARGSDTLYHAGMPVASVPQFVALLESPPLAPTVVAMPDSQTAVLLRAVVSTATPLRHEFDIRRVNGQGQFLTRADFAKHPARTLPDFMSQVPGARLARAGGQVWVTSGRGATGTVRGPGERSVFARGDSRRACYVDVWLDGVMVYGRRSDDPLFDVSTVPTDNIHGLEYYASTAVTPAQYHRYGAECGTLLIWTRRPDVERDR